MITLRSVLFSGLIENLNMISVVHSVVGVSVL